MDTQHSQRHFVHRASIALFLLGLAAANATAQAPAKVSAPARPTSDPFRGFGVNASEGVLWGGGIDFKVCFGTDEVEFTPALGRVAEHDLPLAFSTLSIARGADALAAAAGAPCRVGAASVEYDRGPGVVERHEVRADGLELSFVFAAPPAGTGDLVVRLQVHGELTGTEGGGDLHFVQPGVGGVGIGTVTGVDALGRSVKGSLHLVGDVLELSLPADFVDAAAFPLVLDPFIYPVILVAPDPLSDEGEPDVAYESTHDRFMVVWDKAYSLSDIDIRGQFIDTAGNIDPSGYWFIEVASNTLATRPQVASTPATQRFIVVWQQQPMLFSDSTVKARSISTGGFGSSSILDIPGFVANNLHPDVGGSPSLDSAFVVWQEEGGLDLDAIYVSKLTVPVGSDPVSGGAALIAAAAFLDEPAISKSGGDQSTYGMVYRKSASPGSFDIFAHILNSSFTIGWGGFVTETAGPEERDPDIDGDGTTFFVVYSRAPDATSATDSVYAARVVQSGTFGMSSSETLIEEGPPFGDAQEPSVAFTGNGALVAWSEQFSGTDYDIPLVGLDPWANTIADGASYADFESTYAHLPAVCAKYAATHSEGDGAMCTWQVTYANDDDDVRACLVDPELGVVTDLGGQSTQGGTASVSAATVGNPGFTHFYEGNFGFNSVTLLVGVAPLNAPFCTGTLVPDPIIFLALVTGVGATLVLPTPLPPDPTLLGVTLYEQYAESDTVSPPCGKKIQLSNGLAILIE